MQAPINLILKLLKIAAVFSACLVLSGCGEKTPAQLEKERREKIDLAVKRATVLIFDNNHAKAIEILEAASQECGVDATLYEALANAYAQSGRAGSAAIFFERASDLEGGDPELQISAAKSYERSGSVESAISAYEKYLKMRPQDMVVWRTLANLYESAKRYGEAMNAYMAAIKASGRNPNSAEAAQVGNLFLKLGNVPQAKRWLEAAFEATSKDNVKTRSAVLSGLVEVALLEKDMAKLDEYVAKLEATDKELFDKNYPDLKKRIEEFKAAMQEVKESLAPKDSPAESSEGKAGSSDKSPEEAASKEAPKDASKESVENSANKAEKGKSAENSPAAADAKKTSGEKASDSSGKGSSSKVSGSGNAAGEAQNSAQAATKAETPPAMEQTSLKDVAEKPADALPDQISKVYKAIESKDYSTAEREAHKAIAQNSASAEPWTALAKTYEASERHNDAFLAANEALSRAPDNIDAELYFLRTASKVQNNEQFLNSLYAAQKKFPHNAEIMIGLARTYKEMNDKKNSSYFYRQFLREIPKEHPRYKLIEEEYEQYSSAD